MAQRQFKSTDTDQWLDLYGDGSGGDVTISTPTTIDSTFQPRASANGTIGTKTLSINITDFSDGDIIVIMKMSGTDAGHWELNKVASGGGTTTLTLAYDLTLSYSDDGASQQSQVIGLNQYRNLTINNSLKCEKYSGSVGGVIFLMASESITGIGSLLANGQNGSDGGSGTPAGGNDGGFRGGAGNFKQSTGQSAAQQGEGTGGVRSLSNSANGSGGGGGFAPDSGQNTGSGGGGGNATSGGNGQGALGGTGGSASGNTALTLITMGGGGGGGSRGEIQGDEVSGGGSGGGIIVLISPSIDLSSFSSVNITGGGTESAWWPGGGGAGGSFLAKCEDINIGTSKILVQGGVSVSNGVGKGGDGSVGRIHIDYAISVTGSSTPVANTTLDTTLRLRSNNINLVYV